MSKQPVLKNISPMIPAGNDLEKSIAFYEQQLGFKLIHKEGNPITMAVVKRDFAEIFLLKNDDQHLAEWTTFRIQVDGIEQLYQEFQAHGGHITHPNGQLQTKPWGMKEFAIIDVAGVCITFCEPEN
ncbi:VOC family protein [Nostocaceae cyanobacterium CENA357]|uniref:VOC family protein n=1 Tax=Atlanticothrix silvestris CENA357 TaxID=1725252 RepID=A0A8J7L4T1_9CYAN|nr:VOC family protein [Atlanticothrix silvestris]MBH8555131.1 VOC family protein [Atlanticothrix silvestris CENA357]